MSYVYRASTGLYPSIYIRKPEISQYATERKFVFETLREALRVRALYSGPNVPIAAYTYIMSDSGNFFNESILNLAIRQPAEMGMDAVILWSSSWFFKNREMCNKVKNYVNDILGPYVLQLTERLTDCSIEKCNARGRCVKRHYVQRVPYILGNYSLKEVFFKRDPNDEYEDYVCQCYEGWIGSFCMAKVTADMSK